MTPDSQPPGPEAATAPRPQGEAAQASDHTDPDLVDPDHTDPDLVDTDHTDPDLVDPDHADPDLVDPDPADPDPTDSDGVAATGPGQSDDSVVATPQRASSSRWSERDRGRERELIELLSTLPGDDPQRATVRDEMVTMHLPLASFLARRFRDRGESLDDLTQVATIGLIKAVDRFDAERGVEFSTFATPTIAGEIKRHFRDKGWAIRVPRRLQELRILIGRATAELSQSTGRSPTVAELASHIGVSDDEILEGMESAQAYATLSLDASSADSPDEGAAALVDTLGEDDPGLHEVETRQTLHPLVATLPVREQRILHMRFYENMTQSQIAEQIGVSQMHVSRLLAKSLAQLRGAMAEPLA